MVLAYLDFYVHNRKKSFDQLATLSRSKDSSIRYVIAVQLSMRELDIDHVFGLVEILADNTDYFILDEVAIVLATKCKVQTDFCLSIIKKWIDSDQYSQISSISWTLNEIGKTNLKQSLQIVKNWFLPKDARIHLLAPEILWELGKHDKESLMDSLLAWSSEKSLRNITLGGIRKLLSEIYPVTVRHDKIVDICFDSLYELAKSEGIDAKRVSKRENEKTFKCCALIDELQRKKPQINYEKVFLNVEQFPNIKGFLGVKWFEEMREESNVEHPLLIFFSRDLKNSIAYNAFLSHLDQSLKLISNT